MLSMAIIIAITITIIFTVIFTPEEENILMTTNKENEYSNLCDLPIMLQSIYIYRVFDNCGDSFHGQLQRTKLRRKVL